MQPVAIHIHARGYPHIVKGAILTGDLIGGCPPLTLMATVLLEIGVEEIPARYMPPALAQLYELAQARFARERIAFTDARTWGTPRRITLYMTEVAELQEPTTREVRGPSVQSAFATNGEPTQAAIGFARSQGVPVSELRIREVDDSEYVFAVFRDEGAPVRELLPDIFADLIDGLTFPKTMRWAGGDFRFARPIRWIVALMNDAVIPLTVNEVASGRRTHGHRFLSPGAADIPTAADYHRIMDENQVLVEPDQRRTAIAAQLEALTQPDGARIMDDGSLLETITYHVEFPTAVRCAFDQRFLSLPAEVLTLVLRGEQEFFPLAGADGELLPAFIGVRNGDKAYLASVREGYEAVAHAKLLDALFFYELDIRTPLAEWVEALRGVVFLEGLGTLHDKVMRLQRLAGELATELHFSPADAGATQRAALLSKADLVTSLVSEHPELQGVMGRIYAAQAGEPAPVAAALGEQYAPRAAGDPIPATPAGRIVALVDKLDTITACFMLGFIPTGSEDPYALRREAMGVVRILGEANYRMSLSALTASALALLPKVSEQSPEAVQAEVTTFLTQRVEALLAVADVPLPIVRAVLAVSADVPADALRKALLLQEQAGDPGFTATVRSATRLANITRTFPGGEVPAAPLTEPAERELFDRYQEVAPSAKMLAEAGDFAALLELLSALTPDIDRFFAETLVMAEDPELRQARLALAWQLAGLFRLLADFTQLTA